MANEIKAGQNITAKFYEAIISNYGETKTFSTKPSLFWCMKVGRSRVTRGFMDAIEGKQTNVIIASTNLSKLTGLGNGGQIEIENEKKNIEYYETSEDGKVVYIALK